MDQNIFHIACTNGWMDFVVTLLPPKIKDQSDLRKSIKIDFIERRRITFDFKATDKYNETGLLLACKHGWKNIVEYLLKHRHIADIDIASTNDITGKNCFLQAVLHKRVEVTKLLIDLSVSDEEIRQIICTTNKRHETAFHMACIKGTVGNVKHSKSKTLCDYFKCFIFI